MNSPTKEREKELQEREMDEGVEMVVLETKQTCQEFKLPTTKLSRTEEHEAKAQVEWLLRDGLGKLAPLVTRFLDINAARNMMSIPSKNSASTCISSATSSSKSSTHLLTLRTASSHS